MRVSLVRARDGAQLWSERFDGKLDDIFTIQDRVGDAVALRLRGGPAAPATAIATRGEVYSLYLTARGLLRDREAAKTDAAIGLLRQAVKLDPRFAPAWSSLGVATRMQTADVATDDAKRLEALGYARRALSLAPGLAEAHAAYGALIFQDDLTASRDHLQRAAALDPNNSEVWHWLSVVQDRLGAYPDASRAARRAVLIDPLWPRAYFVASECAWERGGRSESVAYARRFAASAKPQPFTRHMVASDMAARRGDVSSAIAHARLALRTADAGHRAVAADRIAQQLRILGYEDEAGRLGPRPPTGRRIGQAYGDGEQARILRRPFAEDRRTSRIGRQRYFMLRQMLAAGRHSELARSYDRIFGSPAALAGHPEGHLAFLLEAALFAPALERTGRRSEAAEILARANAALESRLRQGQVGNWYHVVTAHVLAAQGRRSAAVGALERSVSLGWVNANDLELLDIGDEPAFRSLRGDPRFERLRGRLNAHLQRERREAAGDLTAIGAI